MSTSITQTLKDSVSTQPETAISQLAMNNYIFCRSNQGASFSEMKRRLGQDFAVPFERQYRGIEELELEKTEALKELNDLLKALDRSRIDSFPKGSGGGRGLPITPVDLALNMPVFSHSSYWYAVTKTPWIAIDVCEWHSVFDVVDTADEKVISTKVAAARAHAYEEDGNVAVFGISLPEILNCFLNDWLEGLFPELEEARTA